MKSKKFGLLKTVLLFPLLLLPSQELLAQTIHLVKSKIEKIILPNNPNYTAVHEWLDSTIIATDPAAFKQHLEYFLEQNFFETILDINTYKTTVDGNLLKQKIRDLDISFAEYKADEQKLSFYFKAMYKNRLKKGIITPEQVLKIQQTIDFLQRNTSLVGGGSSSSIIDLAYDPDNLKFDCSERTTLAIHWMLQAGVSIDDIGINIYYGYGSTGECHMTISVYEEEIDLTQIDLQVDPKILKGKKIEVETISNGIYYFFVETKNKTDSEIAHIFNLLWGNLNINTISLHKAQKIIPKK